MQKKQMKPELRYCRYIYSGTSINEGPTDWQDFFVINKVSLYQSSFPYIFYYNWGK